MALCYILQEREEVEEKKIGSPVSVGEGGTAGAGQASIFSWSNAAPLKRRHVLPANLEPNCKPELSRVEPDRPTSDCAEAVAHAAGVSRSLFNQHTIVALQANYLCNPSSPIKTGFHKQL